MVSFYFENKYKLKAWHYRKVNPEPEEIGQLYSTNLSCAKKDVTSENNPAHLSPNSLPVIFKFFSCCLVQLLSPPPLAGERKYPLVSIPQIKQHLPAISSPSTWTKEKKSPTHRHLSALVQEKEAGREIVQLLSSGGNLWGWNCWCPPKLEIEYQLLYPQQGKQARAGRGSGRESERNREDILKKK